MRVGLIAPPWAPVPPLGYGGTEAVVDDLARALRAHGHDIVVFTVGESTVPVSRRHYFAASPQPMGQSLEEAAHVLSAYRSLRDVDVLHDHTVLGPVLAGLGAADVPVVVTQHNPFTASSRTVLRSAARHAHIVAISKDHARNAGPVPVSAVIYHGIDLDHYPPGRGEGGYALFVGRMSPDKGPHRAIVIARRAGVPLRIVAKMKEESERRYFDSCVAKMLGGDVELMPAELTRAERAQLLGDAVALVEPISWPEPFGLVTVEALACGTPVIAFPAGAAPELIDHGRTGYLCDSETEAAHALRRVGSLDRQDCRLAALARFSMYRMARDYESLYERAVAASVRIDLTTPVTSLPSRGSAPRAELEPT